jgi:hypothetical protein
MSKRRDYGIARPMPAADLPAWIESWKPPPSCLFITLRKRA